MVWHSFCIFFLRTKLTRKLQIIGPCVVYSYFFTRKTKGLVTFHAKVYLLAICSRTQDMHHFILKSKNIIHGSEEQGIVLSYVPTVQSY